MPEDQKKAWQDRAWAFAFGCVGPVIIMIYTVGVRNAELVTLKDSVAKLETWKQQHINETFVEKTEQAKFNALVDKAVSLNEQSLKNITELLRRPNQ